MIRKELVDDGYAELIQMFLDKSVDASDFSDTYLCKFKLDDNSHGDDFDILDSLFASCDAYSPEPIEGGIDLIDGNQLYLDAQRALVFLWKIKEH